MFRNSCRSGVCRKRELAVQLHSIKDGGAMSYKSSQLIPLMVTRTGKRKFFVPTLSRFRAMERWPIHPFQSWLARNPDTDRSTRRSVSWGKMLGLALTVKTGATFWTGVGLLVARLWK